jgi:hypothetical protein
MEDGYSASRVGMIDSIYNIQVSSNKINAQVSVVLNDGCTVFDRNEVNFNNDTAEVTTYNKRNNTYGACTDVIVLDTSQIEFTIPKQGIKYLKYISYKGNKIVIIKL